jgi:ethanolamine utilization protein EutM
MIETWGFTPAVEAADTGLKAANVRLLACTLTHPALMTVAFTGDVAAVSTAVSAAAAAAARVGRVVATHVIARPDASLLDRLAGNPAPAPSPAAQAALSVQIEPPAGSQAPAATTMDRPKPPTAKAPTAVGTSPAVPPVVDTEAKTGASDANAKKKPAAPESVAIATAESRQKEQTASRSKPAAVKKRASKKNPGGSAKGKTPKASG